MNKIQNITSHLLYDKIAFFFCLLYAFLTIISPAASSEIKNVILLMTIPFFVANFDIIKKEVVFKLLIAAILIQVISWLNSWHILPNTHSNHPDIKRLTALFFFFCIAIWIKGQQSRINALLFTTVTGFITQAFIDTATNHEFLLGLKGTRVDFGMHNAQFTGMIAAVSLAIIIYLFKNIRFNTSEKNLITKSILFIYFLISLIILVISQTRQVWLGFVLLIFITPLVISFFYKFNKKILLSIYTLSIIFITISFQTAIVKKRILSEDTVIMKVASGDLNNIPMTSVGIRVNSWILASQWIKENPILGASDTAIPLVLKTSEEFNTPALRGFGHLHNYYIETLVAYGLIGLAFIFYFYYSIGKSIIEDNDKDRIILFLLFILFWAVINNFESYNSKTLGIFIHNIIIACVYSSYLTKKMKNQYNEVK